MGYEFFGEIIIFPSAPVPGINNDQSLNNSIICRRFCLMWSIKMVQLFRADYSRLFSFRICACFKIIFKFIFQLMLPWQRFKIRSQE